VGVANFFLGQSIGIKTVGATVLGGLCAATNLRCARSSGICMANPNSIAHIFFGDSSVHPDGRTDGRRTWLDRLGVGNASICLLHTFYEKG